MADEKSRLCSDQRDLRPPFAPSGCYAFLLLFALCSLGWCGIWREGPGCSFRIRKIAKTDEGINLSVEVIAPGDSRWRGGHSSCKRLLSGIVLVRQC